MFGLRVPVLVAVGECFEGDFPQRVRTCGVVWRDVPAAVPAPTGGHTDSYDVVVLRRGAALRCGG